VLRSRFFHVSFCFGSLRRRGALRVCDHCDEGEALAGGGAERPLAQTRLPLMHRHGCYVGLVGFGALLSALVTLATLRAP
jgi:hypothetical protein